MSIQSAIQPIEATLPLLPLAHTTYWDRFVSCVLNDKITPNSPCPRNNTTEVAYLFYGTSFYVLNDRSFLPDFLSRPVGLLFRSDTVNDMNVDTYPFDTGAYLTGRYEPIIGQNPVELDKYVTSSNGVGQAAKLVKLFFHTNDDYLHGQPSRVDDKAQRCVKRVNELHFNKANKNADSRCTAIEVLTTMDISLNKNLEAVIVPKRTFDLESIKIPALEKGLNSKNIKIIKYGDTFRYGPSEDSRIIRELTFQYLMQSPRKYLES